MKTFLLLFFCATRALAAAPLCSRLSDDFCRDLWSEKNLGNMKTRFGEIASGKSPKSDLTIVEKLNVAALVNAAPRFPLPLRSNKRYMQIIRSMEAHMKTENHSKIWEKKLDSLYSELNIVLELVIHEEFVKKYPHLKNKSQSVYTPVDWYNFIRLEEEFYTAMIREKIEGGPYWKRVEKIFAVVKKKTLMVIDRTHLSAEEKETLRSRIEAIELSLPFTDKELLGARGGCSKTEPGAFYNYYHKKITVCAGYFYGFQSDAVLTHLIAHEFAHALDLTQGAVNNFPEWPIGKAQLELLNHEAPVKSCRRWNEFVTSGIWDMPEAITPATHGPYKEFKACLVRKDNLKPITLESLQSAATHMNDSYFSDLATHKTFSFLSTPKVQENGKLVDNFFYLRPDWKAMRDSYYSHTYLHTDGAPAAHFFVYSLLCDPEKDGPVDFAALPPEKRKERFVSAIEKAKSLSAGHLTRVLEKCGDECHSLVSFNLSRPSAENFADWVASKVTSLVMDDLAPGERKDFVSEVGALFCDRPEGAFDPVLMTAEKNFSREPHPENRVRRTSMITTEMAREAGCELEKDQGNGRCQL